MPEPDEQFLREHYEAVLGRLLANGWITEWAIHDVTGRYMFKWTAKGLERSRWLKEIGGELQLGPQGMCALLVLCELHAD
jgi:hypothetical protein